MAAAAVHWRRASRWPSCWAWARCYSNDATDLLLHEYQQGRTPQVVPFEIDEEEARRKFLAWQAGTARLGPGGLLPAGGAWRMRAALLPFWMFDVQARVEFAGSVGVPSGQGGPLAWREVGWKEAPHRQYSWQHDRMLQVYASFKYRRDHAQVVNGPWALKRLQPLPREAATRGSYASLTLAGGRQAADIDPPAMRQAIAWEFVLRDIREAEHRAAEQRLLLTHGGAQARDVHVRLHVGERSSRLALLPCFHLEYQYGEDFNAHGERIPARYEAIISGTGLGARMLPLWMHQAEENRRLRASDEEFERVVSMGLGPLDTGTEEQEFLRTAAEWRRWEAVGAEPWREHKRHGWAERLFEAQRSRRLEREQLRERLSADRARQEEEERREERRQQRWGRSSHHHFRAGRPEHGFAGGVRGGGRSDWLGYYRALGLEAAQSRGHVSQEDIKRAFRRAALRWHPDKQEVADERGKRAARERFTAIRAAYEVLRDPERRRAYDSGEAVEM